LLSSHLAQPVLLSSHLAQPVSQNGIESKLLRLRRTMEEGEVRTHQRSRVAAPHMKARRCSPVPQVWLCTPAAEELSLAQDTSSGSYIGGLPEWPDPPPSRVELECGLCGDPLVLLAQLSAPFPEVESRVLYILGCNKYACSQSSKRCVCVFARTMLPMLGSTGLALSVQLACAPVSRCRQSCLDWEQRRVIVRRRRFVRTGRTPL
jgi:hypothetical protein